MPFDLRTLPAQLNPPVGTPAAGDLFALPIDRRGMVCVAGRPAFPEDGALLFSLTLNEESPRGQPSPGAAEAVEMVNTIDGEVASRSEAHPATKAHSVAMKKLESARRELEACETRRDVARAAYDGAVAAGKDPRQHRAPKETAERDEQDVRRWVGQLEATCAATYGHLERVRQEIRAELVADRAETLRGQRAQLRERAQAVAVEIRDALLRLHTLDRSLSPPVPVSAVPLTPLATTPTAPNAPRPVTQRRVVPAGQPW